MLVAQLPEGEPLFPPDYLTSQTERFQVAELVREQVLRLTHDELPFSTTVVVDRSRRRRPDEHHPHLLHHLGRARVAEGHRRGQGRRRWCKAIGTAARVELERELDRRVHLDLHVKVKADWRDNERLLDEIAAQNREN